MDFRKFFKNKLGFSDSKNAELPSYSLTKLSKTSKTPISFPQNLSPKSRDDYTPKNLR